MNDVAVFGHDHHDGLGWRGPLVPDSGVESCTPGWIAFAFSPAVKYDADCEADALCVDEYCTVDVREVREQVRRQLAWFNERRLARETIGLGRGIG